MKTTATVLRIVGVCAALVATCCVPQHAGDADAKAFVSTFYPKASDVMVRCQQYDTDRNGYVTCTAKADEKILSLECPVNVNVGCSYRNSECRLSKGAVVSSGAGE